VKLLGHRRHLTADFAGSEWDQLALRTGAAAVSREG